MISSMEHLPSRVWGAWKLWPTDFFDYSCRLSIFLLSCDLENLISLLFQVHLKQQ